MVSHAEAICQMLFGHVVGFGPQSAFPAPRFLSGFWRATLDPFGGQMQGSKQHAGPRLEAILGPVKVSGSYSSASCGKVGGILRVSWATRRSCWS